MWHEYLACLIFTNKLHTLWTRGSSSSSIEKKFFKVSSTRIFFVIKRCLFRFVSVLILLSLFFFYHKKLFLLDSSQKLKEFFVISHKFHFLLDFYLVGNEPKILTWKIRWNLGKCCVFKESQSFRNQICRNDWMLLIFLSFIMPWRSLRLSNEPHKKLASFSTTELCRWIFFT